MSQTEKSQFTPSRIFTVPEGVRHLTPAQAKTLENAFDKWRDAASRGDSLRSRERLRLIFLLLRHSGARLGEILGLDDQKNFDTESGILRVGKNGTTREVPLPGWLNAEMGRLLESPMGASMRGTFLKADPGYVRKVFYARAEECGIPKELATPRVLRNTRAVEMLRSGVPLAVVRDILGQSSSDLTAMYQHYSRKDADRIVRRLSLDKLSASTSARNTFAAHIMEIRQDGVMAEVLLETASGIELCAVITEQSLGSLKLEVGSPVAATIKAPHVNVFSLGDALPGSARNRMTATITSMNRTEVLTEVVARADSGEEVCALISTWSMDALNLKPGDQAEFRFKGLSMILNIF